MTTAISVTPCTETVLPFGASIAVVIPVYNHGREVAGVVHEVLAQVAETLIVVNDGSTDDTAAILAGLAAAHPQRVVLIMMPRNGGKGRALWRGFEEAVARGYTHAATIDADGQHHVPDLRKLLAVAADWPHDLIIGDRQMETSAVPARSRTGCAMSRFWLQLLAGQDVPDSQCGLRVYPLHYVLRQRHWFYRFDFETETLTRLAWAGVRIRSVPITCIYFSAERRVTHFRPFADTVRGVRLNVLLVARRLMPLPVAKCVRHADAPRQKLLRQWWKWQAWRQAVQHVLRSGLTDAQLGAAVGIGVFIGVLPLWGVQSILALYVANRLHLNPAAVILGTQVGLPPATAIWLYLSAQVGSLLLNGQVVTWPAWGADMTAWHHMFLHFLLYICIGSVPVALAAGASSLFATRWFAGWYRRHKARLPRLRRRALAAPLDEA